MVERLPQVLTQHQGNLAAIEHCPLHAEICRRLIKAAKKGVSAAEGDLAAIGGCTGDGSAAGDPPLVHPLVRLYVPQPTCVNLQHHHRCPLTSDLPTIEERPDTNRSERAWGDRQ